MAAKKPKKTLHPADQYAEDVISGKIVAGRYVYLACKRHQHDLEHGHERGLYLDYDAGQHIIDFFSFLHHSKGKWAGEQIRLEPWQQFILMSVFGWKWKATGLRRFRVAWEEIARKNGKSTKLSGVGLYGLMADGEGGAEIYTAATKKDQARIIFEEAVRMRSKSPMIKKIVHSVKDNLSVVDTASKFEPLGADQDTMDGLNVHFALIDEVHAHKTRGTWDVLDTATGSREQSLLFGITTAGSDKTPKSIAWEQHRYGVQLLEGFDQPDGLKDDAFFVYIACIDKDDDPFDESVWIKANPNLHVSVSIDDLRRKALKAQQTPAAKNTFLRLHLNVWTDAVTEWIPVRKWDECGSEFKEEDLYGEQCFCGLDLANVRDLNALALLFPKEVIAEIPNPLDESEKPELIEIQIMKYRVIYRFWVPEVTAETRTKRDQVMYKTWIEQGYMKETEGDVIDTDQIRKDINEDAQKFRIIRIAYDRHLAVQIVTQLQADGITMEPFGQGYVSMNAPCKEFEKLVFNKFIEHNRNPIARWNLGNVATKTDPAGNIKLDKEKSGDKIDGMVATMMALGTAIIDPIPEDSVYSKRGLRTI